MPARIDVPAGTRFGRLVVLGDAKSRGTRRFVRCICDCGKEKEVAVYHLRGGKIISCSCFRSETAHGDARRGNSSPEYRAWADMKTRCQNPRHKNYSEYGGRGISVCERWSRYENFLADMGRRPSSRHSLDRINNSGNYEPGNCRWATWGEQVKNRRPQSNWIRFQGMLLTEIAHKYDINLSTVRSRMYLGLNPITGEKLDT